jgi:hypothetical protein
MDLFNVTKYVTCVLTENFVRNYFYEIIQFQTFLNLSKASFDESDNFSLLKRFYEKSLLNVFPNILIALRLYLTIPIVNCSAEREFSK